MTHSTVTVSVTVRRRHTVKRYTTRSTEDVDRSKFKVARRILLLYVVRDGIVFLNRRSVVRLHSQALGFNDLWTHHVQTAIVLKNLTTLHIGSN